MYRIQPSSSSTSPLVPPSDSPSDACQGLRKSCNGPSNNAVQQGRFPCTWGTHEGHHLSLLYQAAHIVQELSVTYRDVWIWFLCILIIQYLLDVDMSLSLFSEAIQLSNCNPSVSLVGHVFLGFNSSAIAGTSIDIRTSEDCSPRLSQWWSNVPLTRSWLVRALMRAVAAMMRRLGSWAKQLREIGPTGRKDIYRKSRATTVNPHMFWSNYTDFQRSEQSIALVLIFHSSKEILIYHHMQMRLYRRGNQLFCAFRFKVGIREWPCWGWVPGLKQYSLHAWQLHLRQGEPWTS